jgi:prophage regulatory protein
MNDQSSDPLLRKADVAARCAVHFATLDRWVAAGTFPAPLRFGPKTLVWKTSTVQSWLAAREREAAAAGGAR